MQAPVRAESAAIFSVTGQIPPTTSTQLTPEVQMQELQKIQQVWQQRESHYHQLLDSLTQVQMELQQGMQLAHQAKQLSQRLANLTPSKSGGRSTQQPTASQAEKLREQHLVCEQKLEQLNFLNELFNNLRLQFKYQIEFDLSQESNMCRRLNNHCGNRIKHSFNICFYIHRACSIH